MKYILFCALAAMSCFKVFAADQWKTYFRNDQVEIQYSYADCHDESNGIHQQKVFLRFINLSNQKQEVSFSKELLYNNSKTSNADAKIFSVPLNAHEEKEGNCMDKDNALYLFSKQLNFSSTELKKFELRNISVKSIQ